LATIATGGATAVKIAQLWCSAYVVVVAVDSMFDTHIRLTWSEQDKGCSDGSEAHQNGAMAVAKTSSLANSQIGFIQFRAKNLSIIVNFFLLAA
jgi:hypothetical protein